MPGASLFGEVEPTYQKWLCFIGTKFHTLGSHDVIDLHWLFHGLKVKHILL